MGAFSYFEPLDPDKELEEFLHAPVTVDSLSILAHDTADGEYITPPSNPPPIRRKTLRPRKAKPLTSKQAIESLIDNKEYY